MSKLANLVADGIKVASLCREGQANPSRIRLRICRVGPSCPACGGAAWIADKKTKKPRPNCKGRMRPTKEAYAFKAFLLANLPETMRRFVSL